MEKKEQSSLCDNRASKKYSKKRRMKSLENKAGFNRKLQRYKKK